MTPDLQIINPITYPDWDKLITSFPNYSFFHTSHWANVLNKTYGYKPLYFIKMTDGKLEVALPIMEVDSFITGKRGVSLPFTDYCEPLIPDNSNLDEFFETLISYGKKVGWKYIETKGWNISSKNNSNASPIFIHSLPLKPPEETLLNSFRKSTQRNIKKAIKSDVKIRIDTSWKALQDFYNLNCITRKEHSLPPQPFTFFKNIFSLILSQGNGIIIRAFHNSTCIAASMFFHFGEMAVYKYGASDKVYQKMRPNNLIQWEAIKYYHEKGYSHFSFGITESFHKGLMQFKNGWTKKTHTIDRQKYNIDKEIFSKYRSNVRGFHNIVFKNVPITVSKGIGAFFYRHIG